MTALRLSVLALLCVVVVLTATLTIVFGSAAGTRWLIERAVTASSVPVIVERIEGSALRGVRIKTLQVRLDHVTIDVKGLQIVPAWRVSLFTGSLVLKQFVATSISVTTRGEPRPRAPLEWVVPVPPITFDVRSLRLDRFAMDALAEPYAPALTGRLLYDGERFVLRKFEVHAAAFEVDGDLTMSPIQDVPVTGDLTWRLRDPELSGHIALTHTLRDLAFDGRVDNPVAADLRGRVRLLGETIPHFDVAARVPAWVNEQFKVADLSVDAEGSIEQFAARVGAQVKFQDLPLAQLTAHVGGSFETIDVTEATLELNDGRAVARGRIDLKPEFAANLTIDAQRLDPALFHESLSGALSGRIDLNTHNEDLHVAVVDLDGDLNGAAFRGGGQISRVGGVWSARDVEVHSGTNHATLMLEWNGDQVRGGAQLDMPELATLIPQLHGDLEGSISLSGTRDKPNFEGAIESRVLDFRDWSLRDLHVDATAAQTRSGRARVTIASVERDGQHVDRVEFDARGTRDAVDATLGWNLGSRRGAMALSGSYDASRWRIAIAEGALLTIPDELWRLDQRVAVTIEDDGFNVSAHCWLSTLGAGRVCVDSAQARGIQARMSGTLDGVQVASVSGGLEGLRGLSGSVSGRWDLASDARGWRGTAQLATHQLALFDDAGADAVHMLDLPELTAIANVSDQRVDLLLQATSGEARVLDAELRIGGFNAAAPLSGRASVAVNDLGFLATFSRRIGEIRGELHGEFDIDGTLGDPRVEGALTVQGARVVLIEPGVELEAVDLTMRVSGANEVVIRGAAHGSDSSLVVEGTLREPLSDQRRFQAHVDAQNLAVRIPDLQARVSGGIDVAWHGDLMSVKGRVEVPRASITISQLPAGAVPVSADVVVVNRVERTAAGARLQADLELDLKDDVRFTAFGLSTGLRGSLRLRQSVDGIVQLNGSLALINGTFKAFDQTLAIDSGRLTYSGPPANPYVDARASRTIKEVGRTLRVGAQIQGPLDAIETTLFSDPSMSEADTLAYLVLGRSLSGATAQQGSNVMGAAIALGLKGAAPVINGLRDAFGLQELTATGGGAEDLTVIAGKRFTNRVFVKYSYQTFTRMSAILIELLLSRRLSLEATASEIPAVDVIYRVGENN